MRKDSENVGIEEMPVDEMAEDLQERNGYRRKGPEGHGFESRPLIFLGAGVLIVIILAILFFGGGKKTSPEELASIKARLEQMEKAVARIEAVENRLTGLDKEVKGMQKSISRPDVSEKAIKEKLERLTQRVDELSKKPGAPAKAQAQPVPQKKKTADTADKRSHLVQKGETVSSIARKYAVSVSEIRRLNNLTGDQINIGDRLIIPPSAR